jgi:hypothetical protein
VGALEVRTAKTPFTEPLAAYDLGEEFVCLALKLSKRRFSHTFWLHTQRLNV